METLGGREKFFLSASISAGDTMESLLSKKKKPYNGKLVLWALKLSGSFKSLLQASFFFPTMPTPSENRDVQSTCTGASLQKSSATVAVMQPLSE
jgi:hypothetical protein